MLGNFFQSSNAFFWYSHDKNYNNHNVGMPCSKVISKVLKGTRLECPDSCPSQVITLFVIINVPDILSDAALLATCTSSKTHISATFGFNFRIFKWLCIMYGLF